jgi:hypothetical protein
MTLSAEGHSPNDTGKCKVRNTHLALPSSVETRCVIQRGLEYGMGRWIGKQYSAACCGLG